MTKITTIEMNEWEIQSIYEVMEDFFRGFDEDYKEPRQDELLKKLQEALKSFKKVKSGCVDEKVGKEVTKILLQKPEANQELVDLFGGKSDDILPL